MNLKLPIIQQKPSNVERTELQHYVYHTPEKESLLTFFANAKKVFSLSLIKDNKQSNIIFSTDNKNKHTLTKESTFPMIYPQLYSSIIENTHCYTLSTKNSLCYPFNMEYPENILQKIKKIVDKNPSTVYFQMLFKKADEKWKDNAVEQYESHLNGLTNPSDFKLFHKFQAFLNDKFMEKGMTTNTNGEIPKFKKKYFQDGFEWYGRLIIINEDDKVADQLSKRFQITLNEMDGQNGFHVASTRNKKKFVEEFKFHQYPTLRNKNQILTPLEMLPFFCGEFEKEIQAETAYNAVAAPVEKKVIGDRVNLVELLPTKPRKSVNIDEKKVFEMINRAFKKLNITSKNLQFTKLNTGATLHRATFKLSEGIKLNKIDSEIRNLEAELGYEGIFADKGDNPGTASLSFMREKRDVVYLRDIIDSEKFTEIMKDIQIPIVLGENIHGYPLIFDLEKLKHLLICGMTGGGKSFLLNAILVSMMMNVSPDKLRFYLIDPKEVEFSFYENSPHVDKLIAEVDKAVELLNSLTELMDERYKQFKKCGVRDLNSYNKKNKDNALPRLVIVIDEFADLIMQDGSVETPVTRLAQKARGCGIHLIIATQKPMATVIPTIIRDNMPARIALKCKTTQAYKTCINEKPPTLLGNGDAVAEIDGIPHLLRFQSPVVTFDDDELTDIVNQIGDYWSDYDGQEIELPVNKEDDDLYRLKKIIFETGETRISELQKLMKIRINKVQDLMEQLSEENWVKKSSNRKEGYKVVISKEDMKSKLEL